MCCCQLVDNPDSEVITPYTHLSSSGSVLDDPALRTLTVENLCEGHSGLHLVKKSSRIVVGMIEEGPFSVWNMTHKGRQLQIGDEVVAVNGAAGYVNMKDELHQIGCINLEARSLPRTVIEVSKNGRMLGLALKDLVIEEISNTGVVKEWMNSNLDSKIELGDFLIEVNGKTEPVRIQHQLLHMNTVRMVFVNAS